MNLPNITTFDAAWAGALVLVALVVQAIAQPAWIPSWAKRVITVVLAAVLGGVWLVTSGQWAVSADLQHSVQTAFITAVAFLTVIKSLYEFFKPVLDKLEDATTLGRTTVALPETDATDDAEEDDPDIITDDGTAPADGAAATVDAPSDDPAPATPDEAPTSEEKATA